MTFRTIGKEKETVNATGIIISISKSARYMMKKKNGQQRRDIEFFQKNMPAGHAPRRGNNKDGDMLLLLKKCVIPIRYYL